MGEDKHMNQFLCIRESQIWSEFCNISHVDKPSLTDVVNTECLLRSNGLWIRHPGVLHHTGSAML